MKKHILIILNIIISICIIFTGCTQTEYEETTVYSDTSETSAVISENAPKANLKSIPEFSEHPYVIINDNQPDFNKSDYSTVSSETYGELDSLGRCTAAFACIGTDLMPTEERGSIGKVKPTGWQTVKYKNVDGNYLYNRCHLIGYQLTAENANIKNLITGTRYLNVEGMLPFEDAVADYIKETDNHVLYRVTPRFNKNELVARGVQIEAESVEDNGKGISFNVYCYNNQPGITIDYSTGKSKAQKTTDNFDDGSETGTYMVNTKTKKFHRTDCSSVSKIKDENKKKYTGKRSNLINNNYEPCGQCKP